jgi:hypothetical protein
MADTNTAFLLDFSIVIFWMELQMQTFTGLAREYDNMTPLLFIAAW